MEKEEEKVKYLGVEIIGTRDRNYEGPGFTLKIKILLQKQALAKWPVRA